MSLMGAHRRVTPTTQGTDSDGVNGVDASRRGELYTYDWKQRRVAEGRGFAVNVGAFSTAITGGGDGTIVDLDQPELVINVESGKVLVPIRFQVQAKTPLLAADNEEAEILIAVDRTAKWAGDGTFTAETALNMRTDNPRSYTGSIGSAFTADMTMTTAADAVLGIELARAVAQGDFQGTPANAMWTELRVDYAPEIPEMIVGPAAVLVYWGGTVAATGFAQLKFLELDASEIV